QAQEEQFDTNEIPEIIYRNTIHLPYGSIDLRIFDNGEVEEDRGIATTDGMVNFVAREALSREQLQELREMLDSDASFVEIDEFVIGLVFEEGELEDAFEPVRCGIVEDSEEESL
ncbi:MAG: hypothetical protein LBG64_00400, partial [Pseudomonadales bacterium]|nr:hypothetical protein [Pseudomonadales bacterium]